MLKHDEKFELEKSIWTTDDFDKMGWHDCVIHGIAFDGYKILFDIDYIFAWVEPKPPAPNYTFWVAPCTLVFDNTYDFKASNEMGGCPIILDVLRSDKSKPRNAEFIGKDTEWTWTLDCVAGDISFKSVGFTQYTRQKPIEIMEQSISLEKRGGVCFDVAEG